MHYYKLGGLLLALTVSVSAFAITPQAFQYYQNGKNLERSGDIGQAEQAYRMAIGLDPSDALSYIRLANIIEQNGRLDEAITLYRTAQEFSPQDKMISYSLGRLLENKQQPQLALIEYLKATDTPNWQYPFAYLSLARLQAKLNDNQRAQQSYQYFLKFYPDHPDAIKELEAIGGDIPLISQQMTQPATSLAAVVRPPVMNQSQNNQVKMPAPVKLYMPNQNFGNGMMPLPLVPQVGQPQEDLMGKALMLQQQGNSAQAIQVYKQAIAQAPQERYPSYLTIADLANRTGNQTELAQALMAYQQFEPNNPQVIRGLGEISLQQQRHPDAIKLFSKALTLNEDTRTELDLKKQLAYSLQMNNEYTLAASHYEKILKEDNDPVIKKNLALALQQSGQFAKALPLYRQVIINEPNDSTLRNDMGQMLIAMANQANTQGQFKEADQFITEAQTIVPNVDIPQWGKQKANQALQVATTPQVQNNTPYGLPKDNSEIIKPQAQTMVTVVPQQNQSPTILYNASPTSVPTRISIEEEQQPLPKIKPTSAALVPQQVTSKVTPEVKTTNPVIVSQVKPAVVPKQNLVLPNATKNTNTQQGVQANVNPQNNWGTTYSNQASNSTASQTPVTSLNQKLKQAVTGVLGGSPDETFVKPQYNSRPIVEENNNSSFPTQGIASASIPSLSSPSIKAGNLKETLDKANALVANKKYDDASEILDVLHSESKGSFDSYVLLGQIHEKLDHSAQAEMSYENALTYDPNNTQLISMLANMERQNGSMLKAENTYKRLAKLKPEPDSYYQLGVVQHLNKNFPAATDSFNQAIVLNPKWKDAYYGLGIAEESNQNYDKAIMAFEKYLKLSNPLDPTSQAIKKHVAMLYNFNILSNQKPSQKDNAKFNVEEY